MAAVNPWEKQPGESLQSFEAFKIFRGLPPGTRSLARVASESVKSVSLMNRWSREHTWFDRADEWDAYRDKIALEAQIRAVKAMNKRHVKMAMALQTKALKRLENMNPDELSPAQLLAYLLEAARLERLSRGEPEKVEDRREKVEMKVDIDMEEVARRAGPALRRLMERGALGKTEEGYASS